MKNEDITPPTETAAAPDYSLLPPQPAAKNTGKQWLLTLCSIIVLIGLFGAVYHALQNKPSTAPPVHLNQETASGKYQAVITIDANGYTPVNLNVKPGTRVVWDNKDSATHQVAYTGAQNGQTPKAFGKGTLTAEVPAGSAYNYLFENTGSYYFHDSLHPEQNIVILVH